MTDTKRLSESIEMYLKTIVEMGDGQRVPTGYIVKRLRVSPVSTNQMIHRLSALGFINHTPYKGVELTEKGRKIAINVLRRQQLWACFLHTQLKIEWSKVYQMSCQLEHISEPEVVEALDEFLGYPETCPYGNPIPSANGVIKKMNAVPLSKVNVGELVQVKAVKSNRGDVLRFLQDQKIIPGQNIIITEIAPLESPIILKIDDKETAISAHIAENVLVELYKHKPQNHESG